MKFILIEMTTSGGVSPNSGILGPKGEGDIDKFPMGSKNKKKKRFKKKKNNYEKE